MKKPQKNKKPVDNQDVSSDNINDNQSVDQIHPVGPSAEDLTADLQRLQAEFINYKKRVELEKSMISQYSKADIVKDLLPVIDDLGRALAHLPEELAQNKWAQGTSKVYDRLKKQLEKMGVTEIESINALFDPNLHEAVQVEGDGQTQIVTDVLVPGYMLGDKVIRHSVVKVTNR